MSPIKFIPALFAPSYKMAAKIEYLYADATEQNSTEIILDQGGGNWKFLKHINPNTQKAVSGIKVWISDFVDGVDYGSSQEIHNRMVPAVCRDDRTLADWD